MIAAFVLGVMDDVLVVTPVVDPVEKFTFDMSADIHGQIHHIYEYYESSHDFIGVTDIYYSYVNRKANLLTKVNYKNGDMKKEKELLFTSGDDFYYIKLFTPKGGENLAVEITDSENIHLIQRTEEGYTVSSKENQTLLSQKEAYMRIAEIDTVRENYTYHHSAYYHHKAGTVIVQKNRKSEKISFTLAAEGISVEKDKEETFKIELKTPDENDVADLKKAIDTAINDGSVTFGGILKEINKFFTE